MVEKRSKIKTDINNRGDPGLLDSGYLFTTGFLFTSGFSFLRSSCQNEENRIRYSQNVARKFEFLELSISISASSLH